MFLSKIPVPTDTDEPPDTSYSMIILSSCPIYAYVFSVSFSSFSISLIIFAILICKASIELAAIIADLLPLAPACASPLSVPRTTTFSPATTSAPPFTSPKITKLPSNSIFCPDLRDPL